MLRFVVTFGVFSPQHHHSSGISLHQVVVAASAATIRVAADRGCRCRPQHSLGFGRIIASETEAPNSLANLV